MFLGRRFVIIRKIQVNLNMAMALVNFGVELGAIMNPQDLKHHGLPILPETMPV